MSNLTLQLDGDALREATVQAMLGVLTPEVKAKMLESAVQAILKPSTNSWDNKKSPLELAFERAVEQVANTEAKRMIEEDGTMRERVKELRLAESEIAVAKKRIASNPQLHDLDLWLQGKVTHIVSLDYCTLSIATVEVALTSADRERSLRLLNLRVDPKANQFWVSYAGYSDGSGSQTRCLLATSLEHAQQRAAEYVAKEVKSNPQQNHASLAASAIRYGVAVSDELRQVVIEREATSKAANLKQAQDNFQRAQKALIDAGGAL